MCVELKPKWGVLPDSPWVTHAVKRTHNRFVMQQHHKAAAAAAKGAAWRHSAFDPMDLFSYHRPSVQVCGACLRLSLSSCSLHGPAVS